jgi:PAS domain S-box-containing protein
LGIAYLFVGIVDLAHTLAYKGMNVMPGYTADQPTQLWITARWLESISLLIAPLFFRASLKRIKTLILYSVITFAAIALIHIGMFPSCYIEGQGLTYFKIISEYTISIVLITALFVHYKNKRYINTSIFTLLVVSIVLTILSEISFTFYISVYGISNVVGHLFKLASFYLIYRALIRYSLKQPYEAMFSEYEALHNTFEQTFQSSGSAMMLVSTDGTVKRVNNKLLTLINEEESSVINGQWDSLVHPDDRRMVNENVSKVTLNTKKPVEFATRMLTKDNIVKHVYMSANAIDEQTIVISGVDITNLHHALQDTKRLADIIKNSPNGIVLSNLDGSITYANETYCFSMGYTIEELIGTDAASYIVAGESDFPAAKIREPVLSSGYWQGELEVQTKSGTRFLVNSLVFGMYDSDGTIREIAAIQNDITLQKQQENKLIESKNLMATILHNMPGGYMMIDENYVIKQVNKQVCDITGFTEEELVGSLCDVICPKGSASRQCPIWEEHKDHFEEMYTTIKCKNSSKTPIVKNARVITTEQGKYIVENFQDVSLQQEMLKSLVKVTKRYEDAEEKASLGHWQYAGDSQYLEWSDGVFRLLGCNRGDVSPSMDALMEKVHPSDRERLISSFMKSYTTGKPFVEEVKLVSDECYQKYVRIEGTLVTSGDTEPVLVGYILDVTKEKQSMLLQQAAYEISKASHEILTIETLCSRVYHEVQKLLPSDNFYIALQNDTDKTLSFPLYVDSTIKSKPSDDTGKPEGLLGYLFKTKKPQLLTEQDIKNRIADGVLSGCNVPVKVWVGIPLVIEKSMVGAMVLRCYNSDKKYSHDDITLLSFLAEEIAAGIHHITLRNERKKSTHMKDILIRELFHRTNNTLQIIASIIRFTIRSLQDAESKKAYEKLRKRVQAMSVVHSVLLNSDDVMAMPLNNYIRKLYSAIHGMYGIGRHNISVEYMMDDIEVDIDTAGPLGMVLTEVLLNIFEHAFDDGDSGNVAITLLLRDAMIHLYIKDSGKGISSDVKLASLDSYGMMTIHSVIQNQLAGSVNYKTDNGFEWQFSIPQRSMNSRLKN